jgi:hypothetical protein
MKRKYAARMAAAMKYTASGERAFLAEAVERERLP